MQRGLQSKPSLFFQRHLLVYPSPPSQPSPTSGEGVFSPSSGDLCITPVYLLEEAIFSVIPVKRDLCVTCAAAPYSRHSRENGNPRRYIQDNVALQAKALDSSLRCAPLRMTVKRASLGKIPELCKGLCKRESKAPLPRHRSVADSVFRFLLPQE